jgi:hypothetical protein
LDVRIKGERMTMHLTAGAASGIGSLPHTDAHAAAAFVLDRLPDLPAIPSLPQRSPAESMLGQAAVGIAGVTVDDDGDLVIDAARVGLGDDRDLDLDHDAFGGLRAFLAAAVGWDGPVKWQVTGPVTFGLALTQGGVAPAPAFELATQAVRRQLGTIGAAVAEVVPAGSQVVVIDEPGMSGLLQPGFPLDPDTAIDLVSGALAAVDPASLAGVHCCGASDWSAILAAGPGILWMPVRPGIEAVAGYLAQFLDDGGWVAWGAVPTDGPVGTTADRHWRELADLWCSLVQGGCDAVRLRRQAIVTPACGLGLHELGAIDHVFELVDAVADRVHGQAVATRLSVGA